MPRVSKGEMFVRTFVIGFGFLSGLFARIGVDPQGLVVSSMLDILKEIDMSMAISFSILFGLLSIIVPVANFIEGYIAAGIVGIAAIILGWLSGYFFYSSFGV